MANRLFFSAALAVIAGAAFLFLSCSGGSQRPASKAGFVQTRGTGFVIDGKPFRFVGANVAVMYRDEDRAAMPETLARAAEAGIRVVRVWAFGEGGPNDVKPLADFEDWPRNHPFQFRPGEWNEEAFVHLDRVIAEAQKHKLFVKLCLTNWWRDTGGVTQYLRWAGINDADDDRFPYGINPDRAMLFYTNETTRRLYREHLEKLVTRRNTITGVIYKDDPTIFGWELMNEAQAVTGRWAERRAWIAEMSNYLRSLDPNHIITPGDWGYRTAAERREWLADHRLPNIDYCDVHHYPLPDEDSFVDSPTALREFIDNRAAAAFSISKPLVFGEFGMGLEGFRGFSQEQWFRAFLEGNVRAGSSGAMFWILTPDLRRGYGVTYSTDRDQKILNEVRRAAAMFESLASAAPPERLTDPGHHLIPRQFAWSRALGDPATLPQVIVREDRSILYRFKPRMATQARFEKLGSGSGYLWGSGSGFFEYVVPERADRRRVSEVKVRAYIRPVLPVDARPADIKTRVTLFVNGANCGSRLIPVQDAVLAQSVAQADKPRQDFFAAQSSGQPVVPVRSVQPSEFSERSVQPLIQEWTVSGFFVRLRAMRGLPLTIRFAVTPESDWLYGVNISNWPEGYDSNDATPVEVEIRR